MCQNGSERYIQFESHNDGVLCVYTFILQGKKSEGV